MNATLPVAARRTLPKVEAVFPEQARAASQWLCRDALQEYADLFSSLGTSLAEAAYRGCDREAIVHLRQLRLTLIAAMDAGKKLGALTS